MQRYDVYITTNYARTVLYVGITGSLNKRLDVHKTEVIRGFSSTYHATNLIYIESYSSANEAIAREKQLKRWSRAKKDWLINQANPEWQELEI